MPRYNLTKTKNMRGIYLLFLEGYSLKKIKKQDKYKYENIKASVMKYIFLTDKIKELLLTGKLSHSVANYLVNVEWDYQEEIYNNMLTLSRMEQLKYINKQIYSSGRNIKNSISFNDLKRFRVFLKKNITDKNRFKILERVQFAKMIYKDHEFIEMIMEKEKEMKELGISSVETSSSDSFSTNSSESCSPNSDSSNSCSSNSSANTSDEESASSN
jgi:hypothetical protein